MPIRVGVGEAGVVATGDATAATGDATAAAPAPAPACGPSLSTSTALESVACDEFTLGKPPVFFA